MSSAQRYLENGTWHERTFAQLHEDVARSHESKVDDPLVITLPEEPLPAAIENELPRSPSKPGSIRTNTPGTPANDCARSSPVTWSR